MELSKTDFVIRLFFKGELSAELQHELYRWIKDFMLTHKIKSAVNMEYVRYDGSFRGKKKRLQFFSKQEVEFSEIVAKERFKYIEMFKLDESMGKAAFQSSDFFFYFSINQPYDAASLGYFTFLLDYDYWKPIANEEFVRATLIEITKLFELHRASVVYGIATKMPRHKMPVFVFNGIGNTELNEFEMEAVDRLASETSNLATKIWEPYWGNLITKDHLAGGPQLRDLEEIVGGSNVVEITDDLLWFKLPVSLPDFTYRGGIHLRYWDEIRSLFAKYNKVI